jgi:glutamine synthetase
VLGWDCQDQLYDNTTYTGWHTGYPDAPVRLLPDTCRELPLEEDGVLFLGEFAGEAETVCPRGTLRRVVERANEMGFSPMGALEYEFFLFEETPHSLREKHFRDLTPLTPGWHGYSAINNSVHADLYRQMMELGEAMDFPLEGIHEESGPGVIEAAITVDDALAAADKAALFKTFIKVLAQRNGLIATFMARWSPEYPGQSGHIHLSLRNRDDGAAAFHDSASEHGMSALQRHFLAGQQRLMGDFLSMVAPTVNSYSRLVPGFWAPTDATWGIENRTTALRLIPGNEKSQRIEYRLGSADSNPYLALAAALASGLAGIAGGWEPGEPIIGNAYDMEHPAELQLPRTLWEAAQRLKGSAEARDYFGDAFVEHFAASREWEEREYRRHISDWELRRYFEII